MAALATIDSSCQERMRSIKITPDVLVPRLLASSLETGLCILDSCGTQHVGSHRLIAGINPCETVEFSSPELAEVLGLIDEMTAGTKAAIFTLSYDFGRKLQRIDDSASSLDPVEPDFFVSTFDALLVHDYSTRETFIAGNTQQFDSIRELISGNDNELI